tara:strand:- start:606 stop:1004 length:399 start_codon:yes stop_codon:yes gene_type:complete
MQTYQNKINLNFSSKINTARSSTISTSSNMSIIEPMIQESVLLENSITPSPQINISPTMQNKIGAPQTENQSTTNNARADVPISNNERGFMPNTPSNQIPSITKNPAPRFSSETLDLNQETIFSPEWRSMRT